MLCREFFLQKQHSSHAKTAINFREIFFNVKKCSRRSDLGWTWLAIAGFHSSTTHFCKRAVLTQVDRKIHRSIEKIKNHVQTWSFRSLSQLNQRIFGTTDLLVQSKNNHESGVNLRDLWKAFYWNKCFFPGHRKVPGPYFAKNTSQKMFLMTIWRHPNYFAGAEPSICRYVDVPTTGMNRRRFECLLCNTKATENR